MNITKYVRVLDDSLCIINNISIASAEFLRHDYSIIGIWYTVWSPYLSKWEKNDIYYYISQTFFLKGKNEKKLAYIITIGIQPCVPLFFLFFNPVF